ncbi:sulfatase [Photobacterium gaetbulicola]|uniref:Putative N-acetylgalactosamine 6-sulfatase (GALNS) n=1 Tax=Photobacterium gaetbulicola Gung47 TaxID=658445 RepID=A0A0C5WGD5_9GAMM|nr:sulfatase [Photobacterium gaetbulicola]AJR05242.1 putative N-acetylgalactosamine 6-sulfatase (GALNS) [Photobacterium gaetbulicola Gung47]PSU06074.1 sulfatase [Photobacterium gaetbulicola]
MKNIFKKTAVSMTVLAALGSGAAFAQSNEQSQAQPNVVILFADDLGYADVGYHNSSKDVETPNIDRLAASGVALTSGYVTAPVCGPSRAGITSGRYQQRFGFHNNTGPFVREKGIVQGTPDDMLNNNFGYYFQQAGYVTGMVGKHHDGKQRKFWPHHRGFDEFYGFNNGAANYFIGPVNKERAAQKPFSSMYRNDELDDNFDEYLTDRFGTEAISFIKRHKDAPFFLYVPFNGVHGPLQATDEDLERYAHVEDEKRRKLLAMNYNLDRNVGRIMDALDEQELTENTIVFFLSDNGGKPKGNASYNLPLRAEKGTLWDGGIRVPFTVSWPGTIPAGQTIDEPVISLDILPTMAAAAGIEVKADWQLDGVDLLPLFTGKEKQLENRFLYWNTTLAAAIRDHDWKLVVPNLRAKRKTYQLFNISNDISESVDLADKHPEQVERLKAAWEAWDAENTPALWGWNRGMFPVETNWRNLNSL